MALPIAVFGATGFVGKVVADTLDRDARFAVQRLSSADCDLTDRAQIVALQSRLAAGSVWVVCAGVSPDRPGPPEAGMMANITMARNLAEQLASIPPAHVIYMSSIDVYGRSGLVLPLDESSAIQPSSYYAISKWTSEWIFTLACRESGIPMAILRLPGVYGPGDTHHGPVRNFLEAALRREPITVYGDGEQRRDLLYVRDVPRIVASIYDTGTTGVFNAVTGNTMSLNEMLHLIVALAGQDPEIRYERNASQIDLVFAPPALLRNIPALSLTPLEKGIRETYASIREILET